MKKQKKNIVLKKVLPIVQSYLKKLGQQAYYDTAKSFEENIKSLTVSTLDNESGCGGLKTGD